MAIAYRYEDVVYTSDGGFTVKVLLIDDGNPAEQTRLEIPFATGSTKANVNQSVRQKSSFVSNLDRTSVKDP